ncbi:MAG: DegT/DnrJ/EryC1/StrS family aminotransferase [Hydrogenophaga sp.]|nr:DegT/DnrJ/EryC1/StrS family aminotransferase [Hydrogenophaga sp.]
MTYSPSIDFPAEVNWAAFVRNGGIAEDRLVGSRGETELPHDQSLFVTRPALPPLHELMPLLEDIWSSRVLSNDGKYHEAFERELASYLQVPHVVLVSNATLGLLLALRDSGMRGKVLTTPFSFVGTSHALTFAGLDPVFVDIDADTLNIDPVRLEEAMDETITGILPVHCFGRSCDVDSIAVIADRHRVPVVYDAAHAFGVCDEGGSILRHGDYAVLSFHATKVFNTFEGGAVICRSEESKRSIDLLRKFGIVDETHVELTGLNAKLNEFQCALGCVQLRHVDDYIYRRGQIDARYRQLIAEIPGLRMLAPASGGKRNHYSFPILVEPGYPLSRDALMHKLRAHGVVARKYFSPLISDLPMYRDRPSAAAHNLPVAQRISSSILCLPMFPDLSEQDQQRVISLLHH